jgi:hypothetical protein
MTRARVLTFHVDTDELPGLTKALDEVSQVYAQQPDFRGLVCLNHDSLRHEIMVIAFWDGQGMEETEAESEVARRRIAETTDLGVSNKCYDVLRLVSGPAAMETAVAEILAS